MSEPTPILVVKTGTLPAASKKALLKAGIVAIEADEPSEVRFLMPAHEVPAMDMLGAAMNAIKEGNSERTKVVFANLFTQLINSALQKAHRAFPEPDEPLESNYAAHRSKRQEARTSAPRYGDKAP